MRRKIDLEARVEKNFAYLLEEGLLVPGKAEEFMAMGEFGRMEYLIACYRFAPPRKEQQDDNGCGGGP
jgi:hypothetical protein